MRRWKESRILQNFLLRFQVLILKYYDEVVFLTLSIAQVGTSGSYGRCTEANILDLARSAAIDGALSKTARKMMRPLQGSDLGDFLADAMNRVHRQREAVGGQIPESIRAAAAPDTAAGDADAAGGGVAFIGTDCPSLPDAAVRAALEHAASGLAHICPAEGVPPARSDQGS